MRLKRKIIFVYWLILCAALIYGCASLARLVVGKKGMEIPQIVAHLEPLLADNKITVLGKIVIQNPTESALDMDKIYLEIRDENKNILEKAALDWERPSVVSREELEAPVTINLALAVLNHKSITVFIRTGFTYKTLGLHIPVESRVAVLHLTALKQSITRPFYVNIFTKFRSTVFGKSSIDFVLAVSNPLSIDLALEDGVIRIYTLEGKDIARSRLARILFKGAQSNQIKGSIKIGNIWGELIRSESVKQRPLNFQVSGYLKIPATDIAVPFKIESAVEIKFSLS